MPYVLVKLPEYSIEATNYYSIGKLNSESNDFQDFFLKHIRIRNYHKNMGKLARYIKFISSYAGALEQLFEPNDPPPPDGVCSLIYGTWSNVRLFCIRFNDHLVVLGGGGVLEKGKRAKPSKQIILAEENMMRNYATLIQTKVATGKLWIDTSDFTFKGDLLF